MSELIGGIQVMCMLVFGGLAVFLLFAFGALAVAWIIYAITRLIP